MAIDYPVISLYTGAGGLDLGLEAAGFRTAVAVEMDAHCCRTLLHNRPRWPVIQAPIADVSSRKILKTAGLKKGEPALLAAGPPCQPFSKSSYWSKGDTLRLNDPRADTLTAYMRVLKDTRPRAFLLENVYGLVYQGKDEGLAHLHDLLENINQETGCKYTISWKVLNAAQYGVPQTRERAFLIGSRNGKDFRFPAPLFVGANDERTHDPFPMPGYRTAWDAISDLDNSDCDEDLDVRGKWKDLLPSIPEGENYLWHTDRKGGLPLFGWRTRYWSFLLKLAKNRPSWTVQATPGPSIGPFHWKNRRLSSRELMRLQTFPDDFTILGSRVEMQRQLGNAVPSLLGEILGREIRTQFLGGRRSKLSLKLLPPDRSPIPRRERRKPVPRKFHNLIGEHAPHPGAGQGPRAFAKGAKR